MGMSRGISRRERIASLGQVGASEILEDGSGLSRAEDDGRVAGLDDGADGGGDGLHSAPCGLGAEGLGGPGVVLSASTASRESKPASRVTTRSRPSPPRYC